MVIVKCLLEKKIIITLAINRRDNNLRLRKALFFSFQCYQVLSPCLYNVLYNIFFIINVLLYFNINLQTLSDYIIVVDMR